MAIYKRDIVNINLETGNIHRSFMSHSIGSADIAADQFGIRVYRDGTPVDLTGCSCYGYFRDSQGNNIALTSNGTIDGNLAYVTLPQACYNYEGQFCLSIKLIGGGVTGTMRIVDGVVDNTNTGSAVAPTGTVPTYSEILAVYDDLVAELALAEGCIALDYADLTFPVLEGTFTVKDGGLYYANQDIDESETWTAAHWNGPVNFGEVITEIGGDEKELYNAVISQYEELPGSLYQRTITSNKYINPYGAEGTGSDLSIAAFDVSDFSYFKIGSQNIPTTNEGVNNCATYDENGYLIHVFNKVQPGTIINTTKASTLKLSIWSDGINAKVGCPMYEAKEKHNEYIIVYNNMTGTERTDLYYQFFAQITATDKHSWTYDVSNIEKVYVRGTPAYTYANDWMLFDAEDRIVGYNIVYGDRYTDPYTIDTRYATKLIVWRDAGTPPLVSSYDKAVTTLAGKTGVWFGTSIPWGSAVSQTSYPVMVGALLQMNIYNESVPESEVSARYNSAATEANPYGFVTNYNKASRDFGASQEELEWVKEHWNDADVFPTGRPSTEPGTYDVIINGYQIKLYRYLTQLHDEYVENYADVGFVGDVDYYIFNHGHNDDTVWAGDTCFSNELNRLMDIILKYNPKAKIVIIGEYENKTVQGQRIDTKLAAIEEARDIPYFRLYKSLGWTQDEKTFMGHWIFDSTQGNYYWGDTSNEYTMTVFAANVPDGIHPNTARDLRGTKAIALACANFLQSM